VKYYCSVRSWRALQPLRLSGRAPHPDVELPLVDSIAVMGAMVFTFALEVWINPSLQVSFREIIKATGQAAPLVVASVLLTMSTAGLYRATAARVEWEVLVGRLAFAAAIVAAGSASFAEAPPRPRVLLVGYVAIVVAMVGARHLYARLTQEGAAAQ